MKNYGIILVTVICFFQFGNLFARKAPWYERVEQMQAILGETSLIEDFVQNQALGTSAYIDSIEYVAMNHGGGPNSWAYRVTSGRCTRYVSVDEVLGQGNGSGTFVARVDLRPELLYCQ